MFRRIELHPIFKRYTLYNDHYDGELAALGDALGRDCEIAAFLPEKMDFARTYTGDGSRNEDWFSWNAEVMAPISGEVVEVYENPAVNTPGVMNPGRAGSILIRGDSGVTVLLGHIQAPAVRAGDRVTEGMVIARVGNNGYARNPHIHLGAFQGDTPLAIGFDPQKVGAVREAVGEVFWLSGLTEEEFMARRQAAAQ